MDDTKLFDGVGMVIDDHVLSPGNDQIGQIVDFLENSKGLPIIKYTSLPEISDTNTLMDVKFILLDWDLDGLTDSGGMPIGNSQLQAKNARDNIKFLKTIVNSIFIPIFIFSNSPVEDIQRYLVNGGLINEDDKENASIFVKSKLELFENNQCIMFDIVNAWLRNVPSMYVIQKWRCAYIQAMNIMAVDLNKTSTNWPNILWNCYAKDGVNPSEEIAALINQNILSRIQPVEFNSSILEESMKFNNSTLRDVLTKRCLIENRFLGKDISTGDLYKKKGHYYLNVRPECDCVERDDGITELYLLKGLKLKEERLNGEYFLRYGKFEEQSNTVILGPINNAFIEFRLKDLQIANASDYTNRLGRVLPPFITYVTQKFGLYIHRQGLPRVPEEVFRKDTDEDFVTENDEIENEEDVSVLKNKLSESSEKIKELTSKIKELKRKNVKAQPTYRLYNCKVNIVPSLRRKKFRK